VAAAAVLWAVVMAVLALLSMVTAWLAFAGIFLHAVPALNGFSIVLVVLAIGLLAAGLLAKFFASVKSVVRVTGTAITCMLIAWLVWAALRPNDALFLARQVVWAESTLQDYKLMPERLVRNGDSVSRFVQKPSPQYFEEIQYIQDGEPKQGKLDDLLASSATTSFLVIKDGAILYEGYFNGYQRDSIVTSFSMAKSFTSALVGKALEQGYIHDIDDAMVTYLPEMKGKGLDELTIHDMLLMSSGIRYRNDDQLSPLVEITQFTDNGLSYSYPNIRQLVLGLKPDPVLERGAYFNYNDYYPILLGFILERTTGRTVSEYLQEEIWKPMGAEYPASWSLDDGPRPMERMLCCINGRAIDFARFGMVFLNNGKWNGQQILPAEWILESTSPDPTDHREWYSYTDWKEHGGYYKYMWWGRPQSDGSYRYSASGHLEQHIYVSPKDHVVIVRFGLDEGGIESWETVFDNIIARLNEHASLAVR
jgi:CubicO group peptidase (beta-lactamase class C family)